MCRPCICRAILAILIIILAWWQIGYNQILITFFAFILLVMALAGNVCCCRGKCVPKEEVKQASVMPATVEKAVKPVKAVKAAPAKKKPARRKR